MSEIAPKQQCCNILKIRSWYSFAHIYLLYHKDRSFENETNMLNPRISVEQESAPVKKNCGTKKKKRFLSEKRFRLSFNSTLY